MNDENKASSAVNEEKAIGHKVAEKKTTFEQEQEQAIKDYSRSKKSSDLTMHVRVAAPFHEYYDAEAFSISAVNLTGPFDILPEHHNFISLLIPCDLVISGLAKGKQEVIKISISGGIMHVKQDEVIVFLDV